MRREPYPMHPPGGRHGVQQQLQYVRAYHEGVKGQNDGGHEEFLQHV
jgi:hypothetical protein